MNIILIIVVVIMVVVYRKSLSEGVEGLLKKKSSGWIIH